MPFSLPTVLVTWFGCGRIPVAPGTMASLATLPIAYILHTQGSYISVLVFGIAVFAIGCLASEMYLEAHPEKSDPSEIVIDEVAGQALLLAFFAPRIESYVLGFILFRLLDILKPWPISIANTKMKGPLGVMVDDVIAALIPIVLFTLLFFVTSYIAVPTWANTLLSRWF